MMIRRFALTTCAALFGVFAANAVWSADSDTLILLNVGTIDTASVSAPESAGSSPMSVRVADNSPKLWLVQFDGAITPEKYETLQQDNLRVVTYVPNNAYIVYGTMPSIDKARAMSGKGRLRWNREFMPEWKLDPQMTKNKKAAFTADTAEEPKTWAVQMVADDAANTATLELVGGAKVIARHWKVGVYCNVVLTITAKQAEELAERSDVVSIKPWNAPKKNDERQDVILAGKITSDGKLDSAGYLDWLTSKGFTQEQFTQSNFAIDISDSGVDNGTVTPGHFALYTGGNSSNASRIIYNRLCGTPNANSTLVGTDGHGNINAQIAGGYVGYTSSYHQDSDGYKYGMGVCPFVKIGSSVVFDSANWTYPNLTTMCANAYNSSSRIMNCSWGEDNNGRYDVDAQTFDYLVRDACPSGSSGAQTGNQELVVTVAAGNAGSAAQTVGTPATAKNVIAVGASENIHPFGGSDGCAISDSKADDWRNIATFSSRGPCADGRIKPDVCAPGTHITGGAPQNKNATGSGSALTSFKDDGSGVCGGINNSLFVPSSYEWYTASSGTSHAAPAVAGACALIRQWFINKDMTVPSPAMTKAVMGVATRFMTGVDTSIMGKNQGMGLLAMDKIFDDNKAFYRDQIAEDMFTATGQTRQFLLQVADATQPVYITLAYSDAPGNTVGNAYNNNLDLVVETDKGKFCGNNFKGEWSVTGDYADYKNNMESVRIEAGYSGIIILNVKATNINSDGVPGNTTALDQDFALVAKNVTEYTGPAVIAGDIEFVSPTEGIPANTAEPYYNSSIKLNLVNIGKEELVGTSGSLQASAMVVPVSGEFNALTLPVNTPVPVPLTLAALGNAGDDITLQLNCTTDDGSTFTVVKSVMLGKKTSKTYPWTGSQAITDKKTVSVNIPVTETGKVVGVRFSIDGNDSCSEPGITHSYVSDLTAYLANPQAAKITLFDSIGGSGDNICKMNLDDTATKAVSSLSKSDAPFTGTFLPEQAFSGLTGNPANGNWVFSVYDSFDGDSGTINALTLTLDLVENIEIDKGSLKVTITPAEAVTAGAQWSVDGGTTWNDSGATLSGLVVGDYDVSFKPIDNWDTPTTLSVAIAKDETTSAVVTYTQLTGSVSVTITPAEAVTAGAQWSVDGGATWNASGATITLAAGEYTVQFKEISGWLSPTPQSVEIQQNQLTSIEGAYESTLDIVLQNGNFSVGTSNAVAPGVKVDMSWNVSAAQAVADPVWFEVFGSKTGGFDQVRSGASMTYSYKKTDGLNVGSTTIWPSNLVLNTVTDGVYTLIPSVNRATLKSGSEVAIPEMDYTNNWLPIAGKRLSVHNPNQLDIDLSLSDVQVLYNPTEPTKIGFTGKVTNTGTVSMTKPGAWVEVFYGTLTAEGTLMPQGTIGAGQNINTLAAGESANFSLTGTVTAGVMNRAFAVVADSTDIVPEKQEINNSYLVYDPSVLPPGKNNGIDLAITNMSVDASQLAPNSVAPGSKLKYSLTIQNKGMVMPSGKVYVELFASQDGCVSSMPGVTLCFSKQIDAPALGATQTYQFEQTINSIGDGMYTLLAVVNRAAVSANPGDETPLDNRYAYNGGRVFLSTPATGGSVNLVWSDGPYFSPAPEAVNKIRVHGTVKNVGDIAARAFWTEAFVGTVQEKTGVFYKDTARVFAAGQNDGSTLAPGAEREFDVTGRVDAGQVVGVLIDSTDVVAETDETDNYDYGELIVE